MAEYGLELTEEVHTSSIRRLWALVQGLPPSSALHRGTDAGWTDEMELLSLIAQANGVKVKRKQQENVMSVKDFAAWARSRQEQPEGR